MSVASLCVHTLMTYVLPHIVFHVKLDTASPNILGVHLKEKYIVMQALHSLPAETYRNQDMPETLQYMVCALMARTDKAGIMHGDMNALSC